MFVVYLLLLSLYAGLTLLYALAPPKPTPVRPWPLLPSPKTLTQTASCRVDSDCESNHVCLTTTCVPKLLRGGRCDPATGRWISYQLKNAPFAICSCLNDHLFTQNFFGGDCTVDVGCGVHGRYDPDRKACECDPGYEAVGLACQRVPVLERETGPCGPDELDASVSNPERDAFRARYLARVRPARCVKRPCSFDALSGRPLKHARFEPGWGCVCDPTYGLFGAVLSGRDKQYLKTEGFDACASIFLRDPHQPIDAEVVTHFYLYERKPVSTIRFDGLKEETLVPLFRGMRGRFMIAQAPWRYDFAQHFFKTKRPFAARIERVRITVFGVSNSVEVANLPDFEPKSCSEVLDPQRQWPRADLPRHKAYEVLHASPICYVRDGDPQAESVFFDRFVVNPQQLIFQQPAHEHLERFNAFALRYDAQVKQWTLEYDHPYKVKAYRQDLNKTNVPLYLP